MAWKCHSHFWPFMRNNPLATNEDEMPHKRNSSYDWFEQYMYVLKMEIISTFLWCLKEIIYLLSVILFSILFYCVLIWTSILFPLIYAGHHYVNTLFMQYINMLMFSQKCLTIGLCWMKNWSTITYYELLLLFNDLPHNYQNQITCWPIFYDVFMRIQGTIPINHPGLIWLCQWMRIPKVNEMEGSCFWNCGSDST